MIIDRIVYCLIKLMELLLKLILFSIKNIIGVFKYLKNKVLGPIIVIIFIIFIIFVFIKYVNII